MDGGTMRIYDTPTHWHYEPDIDPVEEEKLIAQYGPKWKEALDEYKQEYEFYNFEDDAI